MMEFNPADIPFNLLAFQHTIEEGRASNCVAKFSDPRDQIMASSPWVQPTCETCSVMSNAM